MAIDIASVLSKSANAVKFCDLFVRGYSEPAFGARSKSEIDLLVFTCLIEAKAIDPEAPVYEIARALNITPTKVRSLLFNWQLRTTAKDSDLRPALVAALKKTRFNSDGTLLTFGVESPLLKEEITARLKIRGVYADSSFTKEIVRLPVDAFVEFLDDIVDDDTKKAVRETLVKDKQLPDKSFKALATGVLSKLGEKVAGKAGEAIAGEIIGEVGKPVAKKAVSFITGLLSGDSKGATKGITKDDFIDL
ncbi:MAG: hypothetical protein QOJ86_5039 [Bradyrhizobium sp.]|jgi:hypothetical protein|nr:hypothetical protein [Bradyrhizobium sp.]